MNRVSGGKNISPVSEATQNSEKFDSTAQVLPSVYRMAGPITTAFVEFTELMFSRPSVSNNINSVNQQGLGY